MNWTTKLFKAIHDAMEWEREQDLTNMGARRVEDVVSEDWEQAEEEEYQRFINNDKRTVGADYAEYEHSGGNC